jgi:hypothetical protein
LSGVVEGMGVKVKGNGNGKEGTPPSSTNGKRVCLP